MQETSKNSDKLIRTIGQIVKQHRLLLGKSIYAISAECGLSKSTWREVEIADCSNITLTTLWKISDGLGIPINKLLEEVRISLGEDFTLIDE